MASSGGIWAPVALRFLRVAVTKTTKAVRSQLANATRTAQTQFRNITFSTANNGRQAIHPFALLRQQRRSARWHSTSAGGHFASAVRRFTSGGPRVIDRSKLPVSKTSRRLSQFTGRAPFASALRPNLTGGAIPRTASGYTLGGGSARYFSHTPAAPAEVVSNVSAAVRAFWLSGQRARFDGVDAMGDAKYRAVSALEDQTVRHMSAFSKVVPGSFIDFQLSPTITAFSPLASAFQCQTAAVSRNHAAASAAAGSLSADGALEELAGDFARGLKDLSITFTDIKRLSALGDLPVSVEKPNVLRIRFPGVDAQTVGRLCDDLGIRRGLIGEDPEFELSMGVPIALKFPFAPESDKTITSPGGSLRSMNSEDVREAFVELEENPWFSDPEGYESLSPGLTASCDASQDYEGLEGIYRFLQECDRPGPFQ